MMKYPMHRQRFSGTAFAVILTTQLLEITPIAATNTKYLYTSNCAMQAKQAKSSASNFLVLAGGGAPDHNEIALEKNVLYFQRTLQQLGYEPSNASVYFANGNDGEATIRYIDDTGKQQFKVPAIPDLKGASTLDNFQSWMQSISKTAPQPILMYFTGHGIPNEEDLNNNALTLWNRKSMSVKQLSTMLDKMPQETPVAVVMAQCFSGSFANFIYQGGNPRRPVALQARCGFFATIKTLPSVGCTPLVNEADYKDYSSSFFAGLSGKNRIGQTVASADYNKDNKISYAEAHAFAKVDEETMDLPISTSESWLQEKASTSDIKRIFKQPMSKILKTARPEQKYVVSSIARMFNWNLNKSYTYNFDQSGKSKLDTEEKKAYIKRLGMELIDISMENSIRQSKNKQQIAILNKLLKCESSAP